MFFRTRCGRVRYRHLGDYEGVVRISRRVFQRLLDQAPTPERCLEAYTCNGRLQLIAERKLRRRQLTDDLNIEITGRYGPLRSFSACRMLP